MYAGEAANCGRGGPGAAAEEGEAGGGGNAGLEVEGGAGADEIGRAHG